MIDLNARWRGRKFMQELFRQMGYGLPSVYQRMVIEKTSCADPDGLQEYWDEKAKEYVLNLGRVVPDGRRFLGRANYRSTYLDELAAQPPDGGPLVDPPLHPCATRFALMRYEDPQLGISITKHLEDLKTVEIHQHNLATTGWTGLKRDAVALMEDLARSRSFTVPQHGVVTKASHSGVHIFVVSDTGGRANCGGQLPLGVRIARHADWDHSSEILLDRVLPGFGQYEGFFSVPAAVLGLSACLAAVDALILSID